MINAAVRQIEATPQEVDSELMDDAEITRRLEGMGFAIAKKRAEAIEGRRQSGIEDEWRKDEEAFHGIDDFNRNREAKTYQEKPWGQIALGDTEGTDEYGDTSRAYINITKPYCQAFSARCTDMLQPTDEKAWHLGPTPVPSLIALADGHITKQMAAQISAAHPDPNMQEQKRQELVQFAKQETEEAKKKAELAETQIEDWLVECQYTSHVRRMMDDVARIGTGIMKGPFSKVVKVVAYLNGKLAVEEDVKPVSKRRDPLR